MVRKNIPVNVDSNNLMTIGGRLSAERQRLKFTVADFGLQCGVTKQTQIKYEANANHPDTRYLEAAIEKGLDVLYLLTGRRGGGPMSDEHQNLIEAYEAATPQLRLAAFAVLASPYMGTAERSMRIPGYFHREVLCKDDVRFDAYERALAKEKKGPEEEK